MNVGYADYEQNVYSNELRIRHLLISHNAPYLPLKICITFVFHFSWVLQPSQEKLKTILMQNFGGHKRCIMGDVQVLYTKALCTFFFRLKKP